MIQHPQKVRKGVDVIFPHMRHKSCFFVELPPCCPDALHRVRFYMDFTKLRFWILSAAGKVLIR